MGSSLTKLKKLQGKKNGYDKRREYKRETESLIIAAQEQAIRTNAIKAKIGMTQAESKCSLCGNVNETVRYIVCKCPTLAQREYKRRYDWLGRKIHWEVCRKIGFDVN